MKLLLDKVKRLLSHLSSRMFLNADEKLLLKKLENLHLEFEASSSEKKDKISIIMQMPEDFFFMIKFFLFYQVLKKKFNRVEVSLIQLSDSLYRKNKKISIIQNSFLYDLKWNRIYKRMFNGEIVFNFNIKHANVSSVDRDEATKLFSSYQSKTDVLETQYKNYKIGSLIYNYYLRTTNEPTIDIHSSILFEIVLNSVRSINELERIFQKNNYDLFLTSYITYTAHGIPGLIALGNGTRVLAFSAVDQFFHEIYPSFFTHVKNYVRYKELKPSLTEENFLVAKEKIEDRFKGIIDTSTGYMRQSSYSFSNNSFTFDRTKSSVVIFLHCFFDSPHIYRSMIFPDFYEWLNFVITTLSKDPSIVIYLKKHPGASAANNVIVERILNKFTNVKAIPIDYNNIQIATEMKPLAILTVYGTVAHEMAYMGVPVICAGDNPHYDFSFQTTANDIHEYEKLLNSLHSLKYYTEEELEMVKKEVLRFFFLHNCYAFPEKLNAEEQIEHDLLLTFFRTENLKEFATNIKPHTFNKLSNKILNQYI